MTVPDGPQAAPMSQNAVFTLTAFGSTDRTVSVSYTTLNGTAIAGSDFQPAGGAATSNFSAGTQVTFSQ